MFKQTFSCQSAEKWEYFHCLSITQDGWCSGEWNKRGGLPFYTPPLINFENFHCKDTQKLNKTCYFHARSGVLEVLNSKISKNKLLTLHFVFLSEHNIKILGYDVLIFS